MASTQLITERVTFDLLFFHHVNGMYPLIYISKRSSSKIASHQSPIQATQAKKRC